MPAPEVLLACMRPAEFAPHEREELELWLDDDEHERARRFRHDADRHAFVLAHALLRALVAAETGWDPRSVAIVHDIKGRPFAPRAPELHVSLSRHRDAVACAATRLAPVGVDIEPIAARPVDAGLLGAFVVTHERVTARQFFFHWTALEAFWKSCGTGLAEGQPRILCVPRTASRFDVHVERSAGGCVGRGAIVHAFADCALAVVLCAPIEPRFVLKRTHCGSAAEVKQLARARLPNESFCAA